MKKEGKSASVMVLTAGGHLLSAIGRAADSSGLNDAIKPIPIIQISNPPLCTTSHLSKISVSIPGCVLMGGISVRCNYFIMLCIWTQEETPDFFIHANTVNNVTSEY